MTLAEDDGLVMCRLECECRARHTLGLPGEARARDLLASLSCPTCGRLGRMKLVKMDVDVSDLEPESVPPPPASGRLSRPPEITTSGGCDEHGPDMEGDEYLRERRSQFWRAP